MLSLWERAPDVCKKQLRDTGNESGDCGDMEGSCNSHCGCLRARADELGTSLNAMRSNISYDSSTCKIIEVSNGLGDHGRPGFILRSIAPSLFTLYQSHSVLVSLPYCTSYKLLVVHKKRSFCP